MSARKWMVSAVLWSMTSLTCIAADDSGEVPDEVVVVGRQPGPPLWKVSNGDRVLWIFPSLSPVPKDMVWESDRVERVIAEAQEYIGMPSVEGKPSLLLMVNPVNWVRGYRLMKRITRNPDDASLQEVLPPELYARFAALRAQYFPDEDELDEMMRPLLAGQRMANLIQTKSGLEGGDKIFSTIRKFVRRNRDMKQTDVVVEMELQGSFRELADRVETMMESLSPEQEQACFEQQVRHMEEDLDEMKSRANAWAQGYVDEFRNVPLVSDEADACLELLLGSSEQQTMIDLQTQLDQLWLDAAERALATNTSTFAILSINELLRKDGLMDRLRAKGYDVREP